jgi:hypothetical protein
MQPPQRQQASSGSSCAIAAAATCQSASGVLAFSALSARFRASAWGMGPVGKVFASP